MNNDAENHNISTVSGYLKIIEKLKTKSQGKLIFRGHADKNWNLKPKIARTLLPLSEKATTGFYETEKEILKEFRRWAPVFGHEEQSTDLKLLALGQHYGLLTRLLDWTENPLIALWFAVNKPNDLKEEEISPAIWSFDFHDKDIINPDNEFSLSRLRKTKVLYPTFVDKRISSQSSVFTLHAVTSKGKFIPMEKHLDYKTRITKISITSKSVWSIRNDLSQIITCQMLFQDLTSICHDINMKNKLELDTLEFT